MQLSHQCQKTSLGIISFLDASQETKALVSVGAVSVQKCVVRPVVRLVQSLSDNIHLKGQRHRFKQAQASFNRN